MQPTIEQGKLVVRMNNPKIPKNPFYLLIIIVLAISNIFFSIDSYKAKATKAALHCYDFQTQQEAQAAYDRHDKGYHSLYVNKAGKVCTRLRRQ